MIRKLCGIAVMLALPTLVAAQTPQIPNAHASDTAKAMVAAHAQGMQHRATHTRGSVVGLDNRPTWIATPPAQRAIPQPGGAATPAVPPSSTPVTGAVPAQPPQKPSSPGQSGNHRP